MKGISLLMIDLKSIRKTYILGDEEVHAVDNISLSVEKHEFIAIIGSSGSGKSTLMHIVGCLDMPDSGEYYLNDKEISSYSSRQLAVLRNKEIGFIFQQFHLLQKLTALENVELPLIYQGISGNRRKQLAKEALDRVGLTERMRHRPNQMSGGQQQRVAVARALVTNPTLILADEPTGNLDSKSTRDIMNLLHELHRAGNTIMLITHDSAVAEEADRKVTLIDGKIVSDSEVLKSVSEQDVMTKSRTLQINSEVSEMEVPS